MKIVLGVGSPFADDQIGWLVVRELLGRRECKYKINEKELILREVNRPGLNLLHLIDSDYTNLLIIDMVVTNLNEIGSIYILRGVEILGFSGMLSSHSFGVANSLGLAYVLGIDITKIVFCGIEGRQPDSKDNISNDVINAVPEVIKKIIKYL